MKKNIKAMFFAQYWGQRVWSLDETLGLVDDYIQSTLVERSFLKLKPLSQISDEDALSAIRIVKVYVRKDGAYITEHVPIENIKQSFQDVPIWRLDVADFLRSKGYALPFMEYSVEQLIELGWIKLIK